MKELDNKPACVGLVHGWHPGQCLCPSSFPSVPPRPPGTLALEQHSQSHASECTSLYIKLLIYLTNLHITSICIFLLLFYYYIIYIYIFKFGNYALFMVRL